MHRPFFGLAVAAGVIAAAGGCVSDPTGDLSGTPDRIVTSVETIFLQPGDSALITAELRDAQGVALPTLPEVTSSDPTIASVTVADLAPFFQRRFYVKAVGAGSTDIVVSSGSVSHTVAAVAFPATFDGAIAVTAGAQLDTVTISASAVVGFDTTGSTTVLIDGDPTRLISRTATEIRVLALNTAPVTAATVTLLDVVFLPGTEDIELAEIDAAQTIDVSGEADEPGNDDPSDAPGTIVLGGSVEGSLTASDVDDYFVLVLAAPATITFTGVFDGTGGDPDIDFYLFDATLTFCDLDDCDAGTGAQPETATSLIQLPAGTYYLYVNLFDIGDATEPVWYRLSVQ